MISACDPYGIIIENIAEKMSGSIIQSIVRPNGFLSIPNNGISNHTSGGNVTHPESRPECLRGFTKRVKTGCGNLYVTINEDEKGNVFELFARLGKVGGCTASQSETVGRLISLAFRTGVKPEDIVHQLTGISCHAPVFENGSKILSCSDGIAKALREYIEMRMEDNGNGHDKKYPSEIIQSVSAGACPDCGSPLLHEEGCEKCMCGFARC